MVGSIRASQAPTCWYWATKIAPAAATALVARRYPVGPVRSTVAVTSVGKLWAGSGVGIGVGLLDGRVDAGGAVGEGMANGLDARLAAGVACAAVGLGVG